MSATATLATSVHSLCLFSKHPPQPQQQIGADGTRGDKDRHHKPPGQQHHDAENNRDLSCPQTQLAPSTTASTTPALSPPASSFKERSLGANDDEDDPETTTSSISNSSSSRQSDYTTDSSWPLAVDALAQRLWDCGRDPLSRDFSSSSASSSLSSSSNFLSTTQMELAMTASFKLNTKGFFARRVAPECSDADAVSDKECDEDGVLCDGPYVHVNYAVAPAELPTTVSPPRHTIAFQQQQSTRNHQTWQQKQQHQQQRVQQMQGHPLTSRRALQTPPFSATNNDLLCPAPMSAPETKSLHHSSRAICDRLQLIHYQPMTNPFKTMAKSATASPTTAYPQKPIASLSSSSSSATTMDSPGATANSATDATVRAEQKASHYFSNRRQRELLPSLVSPMSLRRPTKRHHYEKDDVAQLPALPPQASKLATLAKHGCVHCKKGNFLEFCFVSDRCICKCHSDCPCNPCTNIRSHRSSLSSSATQNSFFSNDTTIIAQAVKTAVGEEDAHARRSVIHAATSATPMSAVDSVSAGAVITTTTDDSGRWLH
ncbi:hypothetical protein EV178_005407 [Coemansia sp. RSA 1646]|nr:hypothetical protein EV178_005407 [Coemansia sp. RSA 1646]